MDATDRLEAYFRRDDATSTDVTTSLAVRATTLMDPDDALRATVLRRMELRLMGHDVAASPSSPVRVGARENANGHRALAAVAPDEGGETRTDVVRVGDVAVEADARATTTRARAADAVLRRLVAELRDEGGVSEGAGDGGLDGAWTPDGTRWEETPSFLAESSSASARAMREKYPELWSERALAE